MEEVLKKQEYIEEHGGSHEYEKAHKVESEEKLDTSIDNHEDHCKARVIFVMEGSEEEIDEDLFWDELEAFYSYINIKPPSLKLEEYEKQQQ